MVAAKSAVPVCPGGCDGALWELRVVNKSAHRITIREGDRAEAVVEVPEPLVLNAMVAECQLCGFQPEQWSVTYKRLDLLRVKELVKAVSHG